MTRVLLVTNDFPPRRGGIQSYLEAFVGELVRDGSHELTVYAPKWKGAPDFDDRAAADGYRVVRHPTTLMLPEPTVATRMQRLIAENDIETVWFGAAAPLALLGPLARRVGARRIVASTHGHEVGWSMLPVARAALRRIGDDADVVTFISRYTRSRFASAFGPRAALERLSPGVDTDRFVPDPVARAELRARYGLGRRPVVVCLSRLVPRKGQDTLIRAWPAIRRRVPDAALVIVGGGPYLTTLEQLAHKYDVAADVTFTGAVPGAELPAHHAMADVFAMPCRTRGAGLDVEGLGIVYLEASACGVPVIAGTSGGAPETVQDGQTGTVVDGTDVAEVATAVGDLLADPSRAAAMGVAGRHWAVDNWQWRSQGARLTGLLSG
ncbi:alpha-(1-2)-phosphatidylinositol mannosyltransferase [Mycolicibacterium conceptionense]|uniref:GDP-mannose-dependent alpha-(1-6)-phosphatidylinositol monomannoside mannosyltransferase n=1 Tax=Mycolicibacterium conceptionense TaxID=451644 RepID=A0A1A1Z0G0_9MYCO|nr:MULTISPECIES: GDP-mannose-dependent alpha-(1-6)-phosphatidylinositol monomannoside mannosyltransferase [Mycolicibacterium]MCW1821384.1 GDP-mannose-dependent alpha-(1-6)-phosphatidylinositol monomannoside mannosyltransferase [Mycolicibacterium senegalense]OBB12675.1 alpha-(1-2)-phosphatidylinositol mannosyltransferase [Mycolicibacterium conceptionense]OBE95388.1 alpha-(1-2)-phosphatidylinositol mannosyltransferase [Mycolicibacterium conceptionense]OBF18698.1 alpha-(1-2)-phosphatidylinositol m